MFIKKSTFPKMRNWLFFGDRKCSLAPKRCRFYRGQAFAESLCFMSSAFYCTCMSGYITSMLLLKYFP